MKTVTLWRPVRPEELKLLEESGYLIWPPRLPDQPIFHPALNEYYARRIALEWNVKASGAVYVTRFRIKKSFLDNYKVQRVGDKHKGKEYWIPAGELDSLNANLVGKIEVTEAFY